MPGTNPPLDEYRPNPSHQRQGARRAGRLSHHKYRISMSSQCNPPAPNFFKRDQHRWKRCLGRRPRRWRCDPARDPNTTCTGGASRPRSCKTAHAFRAAREARVAGRWACHAAAALAITRVSCSVGATLFFRLPSTPWIRGRIILPLPPLSRMCVG